MESVVRGAVIYFVLLFIIRVSGRRTMAQSTPFDFVLLLIIAETTQQALLGDDFSITNSVVLITTLFLIDIALSYLKRWSPSLDGILDGRPEFLVRNGKIDQRAMQRSRVDLEDILAAARGQHGLERLSQVRHAVLETNAGISIIPQPEDR
jgi:uncharacterized membrane protein YcaP (DUF421 family)